MFALRALAPRRLVPRTLRGRLIAGLMALLTLACATVGLVTYFAAQGSLSRELNNQLQTATGLATSCWEQLAGESKTTGPAPSGGAQSSSGNGGSATAVSASTVAMAKTNGTGKTGTSTSSAASAPKASVASGIAGNCQGLGEQTLVAVVWDGKWECSVIGDSEFKLSPTDEKALSSITPVPTAAPGSGSSLNVPTTTRNLGQVVGTFEVTSVSDPQNDGYTYITGLPLSALHDTLREVALAEAAVFSVVLLLTGVLGTLWVRFSLRPLRRVAITASAVAELPLETGEVSLPAGVPDTDPATETGQVGLAFNRMLGHVENALQRRAASEARLRRFAADASHELRTPLAAIRGYAELALLRPGDAPEPVTHALGRVLSESQRMSVLVDDLLLLARLDAGRPLSREPVDLTRLAIDATSDAQAARPGHRWVLELPDDPVLALGDESRLRQVLGNLLSNAGRHTPAGSTVTVRLSDAPPGEDAGGEAKTIVRGPLPPAPRLFISVTDDGTGIPADLMPELFERFTRADTSRSHTADASSTGLGLAIVDAVVAAHQGAVLVTSRPGMTRFTIVLAPLS